MLVTGLAESSSDFQQSVRWGESDRVDLPHGRGRWADFTCLRLPALLRFRPRGGCGEARKCDEEMTWWGRRRRATGRLIRLFIWMTEPHFPEHPVSVCGSGNVPLQARQVHILPCARNFHERRKTRVSTGSVFWWAL